MGFIIRLIVSATETSNDSPSGTGEDIAKIANTANDLFGPVTTALLIGLIVGFYGMYLVCKNIVSKDNNVMIDNYRKEKENLNNQLNIRDQRIEKLHEDCYEKKNKKE